MEMLTQPQPAVAQAMSATWPITFEDILAARARLAPFLTQHPAVALSLAR